MCGMMQKRLSVCVVCALLLPRGERPPKDSNEHELRQLRDDEDDANHKIERQLWKVVVRVVGHDHEPAHVKEWGIRQPNVRKEPQARTASRAAVPELKKRNYMNTTHKTIGEMRKNLRVGVHGRPPSICSQKVSSSKRPWKWLPNGVPFA